MYIPIFVLALIFCYIPHKCKHIHPVHQQGEKNERKTEICKESITERIDDKDEEFIQLTGMVKDETMSDFALKLKKKMPRFISRIIWHDSKY